MLPESIRFLASKGRDPQRISTVLRRIEPHCAIPPGASFIVADEAAPSKDFKPALLFRGELRVITPLIWMAYIASSFAVFFIVNWTPLVFEALKFSRTQAAAAATLTSIMGAVGGLLLMRFNDNHGSIAITALPVRSIFAVLAICPAIFAVCIFAVGRIHSRMLGREALLEENAQLSVKHA